MHSLLAKIQYMNPINQIYINQKQLDIMGLNQNCTFRLQVHCHLFWINAKARWMEVLEEAPLYLCLVWYLGCQSHYGQNMQGFTVLVHRSTVPRGMLDVSWHIWRYCKLCACSMTTHNSQAYVSYACRQALPNERGIVLMIAGVSWVNNNPCVVDYFCSLVFSTTATDDHPL